MTDIQPSTRLARAIKIAAGCIAFGVLLLAVLVSIDRVMGHFNARHAWAGRIGPEVYRVANDRSLRHDLAIETIYLGDSVALQMFWPGHESRPDVRYLTTNQAVGVPGQFYILRNATGALPNLKTVYLLYTPHSWANALQQPLAKDYFCEFFHTPAEIAQIFRLKRDPDLAASQIGRLLLPNLLAANSQTSLRLYSDDKAVIETNASPASLRDSGKASQTTEPLLGVLARCTETLIPALPADSPGSGDRIHVSPLSAYFLNQIRQWCRQHSLRLRVIPCPCIATEVYDEQGSPYDAPLWYLPAAYFKDNIHFTRGRTDLIRAQFVKRYGLDAG